MEEFIGESRLATEILSLPRTTGLIPGGRRLPLIMGMNQRRPKSRRTPILGGPKVVNLRPPLLENIRVQRQSLTKQRQSRIRQRPRRNPPKQVLGRTPGLIRGGTPLLQQNLIPGKFLPPRQIHGGFRNPHPAVTLGEFPPLRVSGPTPGGTPLLMMCMSPRALRR